MGRYEDADPLASLPLQNENTLATFHALGTRP